MDAFLNFMFDNISLMGDNEFHNYSSLYTAIPC